MKDNPANAAHSPANDNSVAGTIAGTPDEFVRIEHQAMQVGALADDWRELNRRRGELRMALEKAVGQTESQHENMAALLERLRGALDSLADSDEPVSAPEAAGVRALRQRVHEAGIQLALFERQEGQGRRGENVWQTLSFAELSRLGLAFFLPLMIALLLAAGIVAVALNLALGM